MEKKLLIGLDLSFNSTGICITYMEDNQPKIMKFYKVVFDNETNKTGKVYKPKDIPNINQIIYRMPTNLSSTEILGLRYDKNDYEQLNATIQAMICSKKICKILTQALQKYLPDNVIVTIENYVMPSFGGPTKLKEVSGLILLQGYIREFIIRYKITNPELNINIFTPSPTSNKKSFCGNGKADKQEMIDNFVTVYDGNRLLPDLSHGKIDDVVDAFSLMVYGYKKHLSY